MNAPTLGGSYFVRSAQTVLLRIFVMVTMVDVARLAGVSKATVSRALSQPDIVDKNTRDAVRTAVAKLRYRPNAMARSLASRSSQTVGVVINRFDSIYFGSLLAGAENAITDEGFKMLAESARECVEGERDAWASLLERQCDAVIVHSDNMDEDELVQWMAEHPTSLLMNRLLPGFEDRCIHLDNCRGGALAANYLYDKGHRQVAMVTGPNKFYEVRDRSAGFEKALAQYDLKMVTVESDFRVQGGYEAMVTLLHHKTPITAVFFQNDEMAAGALEACRERGVDVPQNVSMIGFDDIPSSRHLMPKLTTIRQPLRKIGAAAGQLAYALAVGENDTSHIPHVFEAEVVERASVLPLTF